MSGLSMCELAATAATEKSERTNSAIKHANASDASRRRRLRDRGGGCSARVALGRGKPEHALRERQRERQRGGERADLGDHGGASPFHSPRCFQRFGDFARHVVFIVLARARASASNAAPGVHVPSATTPWPSRKRSGSRPS